MEIKVLYKSTGLVEVARLANCTNILDGIYKFYDIYGVCEIINISVEP